MNARLYDPKLHRFLTPDNYIANPYDTQDHNRYGYALNNPFMYTDPTGNTNEIGDEGYGNYNVAGADGNWLGDLFKSIAYSWDDPGFKEWRKGAFNWKVSDWMQNNFSWGSWFKNNLGAVTDWLGFGKEKLGFYYPASTYSFASSAGSSNMYASNSVSPMMGYNNGVEMHPFASQNVLQALGRLGLDPDGKAPADYSSIRKLLTDPAFKAQWTRGYSPKMGTKQFSIDKADYAVLPDHGHAAAITDVTDDTPTGNITMYRNSFVNWKTLAYNLVHELEHRFHYYGGSIDIWMKQTNMNYTSVWNISEYYAHLRLEEVWGYQVGPQELWLSPYIQGLQQSSPNLHFPPRNK